MQQVIHQVCLLCHGLLLTQKLISGFMLCLTLFRLLRPHFDLLYLLGPHDPRLALLVLFSLIPCLRSGDWLFCGLRNLLLLSLLLLLLLRLLTLTLLVTIQLLHPQPHDILHLVENLKVDVLIGLLSVNLIRNAPLAQMLLPLDLVELGRSPARTSVDLLLDLGRWLGLRLYCLSFLLLLLLKQFLLCHNWNVWKLCGCHLLLLLLSFLFSLQSQLSLLLFMLLQHDLGLFFHRRLAAAKVFNKALHALKLLGKLLFLEQHTLIAGVTCSIFYLV